ncbi:MAG: hypothetical protein AB8I08_12740 [Sandaracinaceae bacterium]
MGTYNQLSKAMTSVRSSRRSVGGVHRGGPDADGTEAPYFCPQCGSDAVVETDCERCGTMTVARKGVVLFRRPDDGSGAWPRGLLPTLGGAAVLGGVLTALLFASGHFDSYWLLYLYTMLSFTSITSAFFGSRVVRKRFRERDARRRAEARVALPSVCIGEMPIEATGLSRVRGRLRVASDGGLQVEDERGVRARIDVRQIEVRDDDGALYVLHEGDDVDVVGCGAKPAEAGAYRGTQKEVVLGGTVTIVKRG